MTEEHVAETGDLELDRRRPPCDAVDPLGAEPRGGPARRPRRVGRPPAERPSRGRRCPAGSARARPSRAARGTRREAGRRRDRRRRRSRRRPSTPRVGEHGLERRQVPVDVVERGDPHAGDAIPLRSAPGATRRPARCRGAAPHRRDREPDSRSMRKSLGVGRKSPSRIRAIAEPSSASSASTSARENVGRDHLLGRLEELVDDLDVVEARAHARKGVDDHCARYSAATIAAGSRPSRPFVL